MKYAWFA